MLINVSSKASAITMRTPYCITSLNTHNHSLFNAPRFFVAFGARRTPARRVRIMGSCSGRIQCAPEERKESLIARFPQEFTLRGTIYDDSDKNPKSKFPGGKELEELHYALFKFLRGDILNTKKKDFHSLGRHQKRRVIHTIKDIRCLLEKVHATKKRSRDNEGPGGEREWALCIYSNFSEQSHLLNELVRISRVTHNQLLVAAVFAFVHLDRCKQACEVAFRRDLRIEREGLPRRYTNKCVLPKEVQALLPWKELVSVSDHHDLSLSHWCYTARHRDSLGRTSALMWAIERGGDQDVHELIALLLREKDFRPNPYLVHIACTHGRYGVVPALLEAFHRNHFLLNYVDEDGNTALMYACKRNQSEAARKIILYGGLDYCYAHCQNMETTALTLARKNGMEDVRRLLERERASGIDTDIVKKQ